MKWMENVFFTPDGANLEYMTAGTGSKLLFLPDCEQKEEEMESLAGGLASRYQLYRLNRRGWGNSAPRGDGYSLEQDCQDVRAFMREMRIPWIFAMGGYAGLIALQLAAETPYPRAVLFDPYLPEQRGYEWLPRMKEEIGKKKFTKALVTYMKGSFPELSSMPRFVLHQMIKNSFVTHDREKEMKNSSVVSWDPDEMQKRSADNTPDSWKRAMVTMDGLVMEAEAAQQFPMPDMSRCPTEFLLFNSNESQDYVEYSIRKMLNRMPRASRKKLDFSGSGNAFDIFDHTMDAFLTEGTERHI